MALLIKATMSKRTGYLIWIVVGVLATAAAVFFLRDASNKNDDFRLFRRIIILVIVVVMTIRYIVKYVKEGRGLTKDEVRVKHEDAEEHSDYLKRKRFQDGRK